MIYRGEEVREQIEQHDLNSQNEADLFCKISLVKDVLVGLVYRKCRGFNLHQSCNHHQLRLLGIGVDLWISCLFITALRLPRECNFRLTDVPGMSEYRAWALTPKWVADGRRVPRPK